MINSEYVNKGLQRLQEIENLLDIDFFSELCDRQGESNVHKSKGLPKDLQQCSDVEDNLSWIASSIVYYKERINDLQKVLRGEMTSEDAEERILGVLAENAEFINEIIHQKPMMIDGIPHYKLHIDDSSNDVFQLQDLAKRATGVILDHLDFSQGKASVAFWTNGIPELIYISTFRLSDDGTIDEERDMSSSTL